MNQENALPRRKAMLYYPSQPKPRPVRLREKDRDPYDGLRPWSAITLSLIHSWADLSKL